MGPESILTIMVIDSGLATASRPGMTGGKRMVCPFRGPRRMGPGFRRDDHVEGAEATAP